MSILATIVVVFWGMINDALFAKTNNALSFFFFVKERIKFLKNEGPHAVPFLVDHTPGPHHMPSFFTFFLIIF
jgi:hypothetical protein